MASVIKAILIGNLGKDPETRYMPNGDAVTNITVATTESWKDKNGEKQEKTEWHRVTLYRRLAEVAGEYLHKGSSVYIEGKLETKKWTDKQGVERYSTDIIASDLKMLGSKPSGDREEKKFEGGAASAPKSDFSDFESDIPFIFNTLYSDSTATSKAFLRARRTR